MSFLELRRVSKSYGEGATEVHAINDVDLSVERGLARCGHGTERLGKVDPVHHRREPRGADERRGADRWRRRSRRCRETTRPVFGVERSATSFRTSICWPGLTAVENVRSSRARRASRQKRPMRRGWRRSRSSGSPIERRTIPTSSLAASANESSIARAVVGERHLLLADEPSGALDSTNGEAVMRMILGACKRGVAAVVVTHDAQLASWADRVVFLRDGRVVDQTVPPPSPEALLEESRPSPRR